MNYKVQNLEYDSESDGRLQYKSWFISFINTVPYKLGESLHERVLKNSSTNGIKDWVDTRKSVQYEAMTPETNYLVFESEEHFLKFLLKYA